MTPFSFQLSSHFAERQPEVSADSEKGVILLFGPFRRIKYNDPFLLFSERRPEVSADSEQRCDGAE